MTTKIFGLICLLALILSGCTALPMDPANSGATPGQTDPDTPENSDSAAPNGIRTPLDPIPGEESMTRSGASVTSSELRVAESFPVQVFLDIKGTLPTPCHHLRAKISLPDADNQINVEVYSLVNPDEICVQVLQEFNASLPLGSFAAGDYQVQLNGQNVGEFTQ
jgi:hypothetical protein